MITHVGYVTGAGPVVGIEVWGTSRVELVEVEIVESVEDAEEVEGVVEVELATLLETIPRSRKYWAEGSVAMMSSVKTHWATTEPFPKWCVYAAMRFFESLT